MEVVGEVNGSSSEHINIVKGKRTKRQRALSPPTFNMATTTTSSSSGGGGGGSGSGGGEGGGGGGGDDHVPTSSIELYESTEEEEDMANCLILLAQGHSPNIAKNIKDDISGGGGGGGGGDREGGLIMEKFNSRRFTETGTTTTGKAGFYVYECKTCNRCFPSFQALGGHRASHKKPKAMVEEKKALMLLDDDHMQFNHNGPSLTLQMSNRPMFSTSTNNKSKVHECSICGSEFSSGQALGGHMRRHRTTNVNTSTSTTTTTNMATTMDTILPDDTTKKTKNVLSLDLNLPAPEDDRDSKFPFNSKQQALVFSASSLVDCHY